MYVRSIAQLSTYYQKPPDHITEEELRQYFLYNKNERKWSRTACTIALCGIIHYSYHSYVKELIGKRLDIEIDHLISKDNIMKCPDCGHALVLIAEIPKKRGPPDVVFTMSKF